MVVCSFYGGGGSAVAKRLAALGGWRHIDVYEQTAHRLGWHRGQAGWPVERPAWADTSHAVLSHALQRSAPPIIGLTDGCWLPEDTLDLVRRCADIVFVNRDWLELQERVLAAIETHPERMPEFNGHPYPDLHTLRLMHAERTGLYKAAAIRVQAKGQSSGVLANRVHRALTKMR